jgi:hypothetical protein
MFISMQRHSIDTQDFSGWHKRTKPEFRDAISKVDPFLCYCQRSSMNALWREYETLSNEQLKQESESDWVQEIDAIANVTPTRKPSEILHDYLNRFKKITK